MRFKKTACLLILAMLLGTLGCGTGHDSNTLKLALRSGTYSEVIKACLPEFEQKTGITCIVEEFSEEDLRNTLFNDAANSTGDYDICMVDGSWTAEFMAENVLACLTDLGYDLDDDIIPAATSAGMKNGKVYLVPYYGNVTVALYNKSCLEAAGLSEKGIVTLDDLMTLCKTASASGKQGFIYRGDTENNIVVDFLPILCACGGWVVDRNNNPTIDTAEFAKAMTYYLELIGTGSALKKEDLIKAVDNGDAAIGIGWPGWYIPSSESNAYYSAVPGKYNSDSVKYNSNIYGIWEIGIPENSPNKENAIDLVKYLMDPEVQKSTVDLGGVPCRYSSLRDSAVLEKYPYYKEVCEALENGVYRPIIQEWPQFYMILGTKMRNIIEGKESIADGLKIAQDMLSDLMKK